MSVTTTYDTSLPPDGFGHAAIAGDLSALSAAADWFRDRGQPADPENPAERPSDEERAYEVEVLRAELEVCFARARNNRRLLSVHTRLQQAAHARLSAREVESVLSEHGIYVGRVMQGEHRVILNGSEVLPLHLLSYPPEPPITRNGYLLVAPTDGQAESQTRAALVAFLKLFFPKATFLVAFRNLTDSDSAHAASSLLGIA